MPAPFLADAQALADELVAIRRDLHRHPELGFQEVRTARIVFLGARNEERGIDAPHHNPRFDIDEACLPAGVAILCESAVRILNDR
jgi:metal-dependent amidase/aminoacylase/carboxypeptidase family protein